MLRIAVVLAGGKGERFGSSTPKQFIKLSGRLVIEHTIEVFETAPDIDEIIVVCPANYVDHLWELAARNDWKKIRKIATGGMDRFGSTDSAIATLAGYPGDTLVLFHDAVRPFVSYSVISRCLEALQSFEAVDVVIPSSDTLVVIHDNGCIASIPPRSTMRRGQTPQGFRLQTIREAYRRANMQGLREFTCDCGVVRGTMPQISVATVAGDETNIKITNPLDLFVAEKLMQSAGADPRGERGGELSGKSIVIFGGSSGIGESIATQALSKHAKVWIASRSANHVDVTNSKTVSDFFAEVYAASNSIDFVINCAGLMVRRPLNSMSASEIDEVIRTNYIGAINVALAGKTYLAKSKGMLVNFTSSSYTRGRAQYAVYSSTKSAVVNLTQALADEWWPENIRVNCMNPERTRTPMRTINFGLEPVESLLDPAVVAERTLQVLTSAYTGMIIDVRRQVEAQKS